MFNIFFKIFTLIIILSTLGILALKPKMHNKVLVYDSEYVIVQNDDDNDSTDIISQKEQSIVVQKTMPTEIKQEIKSDKKEAKKQLEDKKITYNPIQKTEKLQPKNEIKTTKKEMPTVKKETPKTVVVQEPKKVVQQEPKQIETKVRKPNVQNEQGTIIKQTTPETKILTQKEEEIAWNIWRSNLQNQIMKDVKLPYIPKGTVFKFSFNIDKYGRITSIKTWSLTPNYTPYAIQYIAPVIRSYQGKNILDFPEGTQRLTTTFTGGWKISDNAVYSTPNDYNDIEKVKK